MEKALPKSAGLFFSDHGVGVGLRKPYHEYFLSGPSREIAWAEVISENFMLWENKKNMGPLKYLERVREHTPISLHGVSLGIGNRAPTSKSYLSSLYDLQKIVQPISVSDHLCWTGINGIHSHDLLPIPYTRKTLLHIARRIQRVQETLKRRILIENVSAYVNFNFSEMQEWEFLAELCKESDCGLLLDINNVYVSSVNLGFDPLTFLKHIPSERVGQIHMAGHTDRGDYIIDSHDHPVCNAVWNLYRWWVENKGLHSTMIERDSHFPPWNTLLAEIKKISQLRLGVSFEK